jgi:hypothetical protein
MKACHNGARWTILLPLVVWSLMSCAHEVTPPNDCEDAICGLAEVDDGARPLVVEAIPVLPFVSVSDGGTYPDGFLLQVSAPAGTAYVVYSSDRGDVLGVSSDEVHLFSIRAELGSAGRHLVVARAFGASDEQLAEGRVELTVSPSAAGDSIVITTPSQDGGHYLNGVWFKAMVTGAISSVRYSAQGWSLGESVDKEGDFAIRYTFSQPGLRTVLAEGLSENGEVLATTTRTLLVVDPSAPPTSRAGLASALLTEHAAGDVVFWEKQFGNRIDGAAALQNIRDTANGGAARRSVHGSAPGGTVFLSTALLDAMLTLERNGYRFFVTSLAGGAHSSGSLHYTGRAFDIDEINGVRIYGASPLTAQFMSACWNLGAVEVFGPSNDPVGHFDHVHCAF